MALENAQWRNCRLFQLQHILEHVQCSEELVVMVLSCDDLEIDWSALELCLLPHLPDMLVLFT